MFKDTKEGETHSFNDGCGEPQHNDMTTMTPLQKEIEAFEKEKLGDLNWCGNEDHECECSVKKNEIKSFLRQSLLRFTKSVIEETMPEEKTEDNDQDFYIDYVRNKGWNEHHTQFKKNVERILKDNEKEV